jgi:putative redox protein
MSEAKISEASDARVVMARTNPKARIGQEIVIGPHRLRSDEPEPVGEDTGPTPHQLLAAALGACTAMTLTLYARRKEWPLESVSVVLRHQKIDARDCPGCQTREGKVDHIERAIQLGGSLSDDQRSRLLEIADRCPVRRTLEAEIHVESRLV